ncbi:MAG: DUF4435 domain-containing protein [Muribaculaceae bacterium]|nr:DUF4435 domain-containing protein [Muribaculaceae bacterium]
MELKLPMRSDGSRLTLPEKNRRIIIIGANGAGKSRFTESLIADNRDRAFRLSALNAIYRKSDADMLPGSIDRLYDEIAEKSPFIRNADILQFERLMALMIQDEVLNLISYKVSMSSGENVSFPTSRLDRVIEAWQEVFPDNHVLREGGKLLFSRNINEDIYSSVKLSDGEKAVLFYFGATLYAPDNALVFVDSPGLFLHPSIMSTVWEHIEQMRPDCTFIYTTHDIDFVSSRLDNVVVWVRSYDALSVTWDYAVLPPNSGLSDDLYMTIVGARKPVLFIEGDGTHSIDSKLYPLIFTDYTVKPLGSCNKVIEATRTFNDLSSFHHLDSHGIVDRDRRDAGEVKYLRDKKIFVPDVAEIENILMLEEVIRTVARRHGKDESRVFAKVKSSVISQFRSDIRQQALLHTRHRVKRMMEYRVDARFQSIAKLEEHMVELVDEINPRGMYEAFCRDFHKYADSGNYQSVLRVYNQKSMLPNSNVAGLCGLRNKDEYVRDIIGILKENKRDASRLRAAIIHCFGLDESQVITPRPEQVINPIEND